MDQTNFNEYNGDDLLFAIDEYASANGLSEQQHQALLLSVQEQRLRSACRWHQVNDRNGDFLEMWAEYQAGDIDLSTVQDVCERVFVEIRDEHLDPGDTEGQAEMNKWLAYIG